MLTVRRSNTRVWQPFRLLPSSPPSRQALDTGDAVLAVSVTCCTPPSSKRTQGVARGLNVVDLLLGRQPRR